MAEKYIQLEKDNILRLGIKDSDGIDTGSVLEFDLTDIELPLKYQELVFKDKKNREELQNQLVIIEKKQDVKGKGLVTKNQEAEIRAIMDFFKKEKEVYDLFLGEGGMDKLLNGRKLSWNTLKEIDSIIESQIFPYIEKNMDEIKQKVKNTYGVEVDTKVLTLDE